MHGFELSPETQKLYAQMKDASALVRQLSDRQQTIAADLRAAFAAGDVEGAGSLALEQSTLPAQIEAAKINLRTARMAYHKARAQEADAARKELQRAAQDAEKDVETAKAKVREVYDAIRRLEYIMADSRSVLQASAMRPRSYVEDRGIV